MKKGKTERRKGKKKTSEDVHQVKKKGKKKKKTPSEDVHPVKKKGKNKKNKKRKRHPVKTESRKKGKKKKPVGQKLLLSGSLMCV